MVSRLLLVALVLQLSTVALGGAAERCAQPGALRCEDGRHQSVCLERSLVWHRVRDCAASGGFCADGRCVGGVGGGAARKPCSFPADGSKCSEDCTGIDICLATNVFTTIKCSNGELCYTDGVETKCVEASESKCRKFQCNVAAKFPDLKDPYGYFDCPESGGSVVKQFCKAQEGYFNACEGSCDVTLEPPSYFQCYQTGDSFPIIQNPSLYVICLGKDAIFHKCDKGYYEIIAGKCIGSSAYCDSCTSGGDGTTSPPITATPPTVTPNPSECFGPSDQIADPTDPCFYYYCLPSGGLERRRCLSGTIFVAMYRMCVSSSSACP